MRKLNPREINTTALAFLGDAVYEVYVRNHLMENGDQNADRLHKRAIRYVCAAGQDKAVRVLMDEFLTDEEIALVKRARNRKTATKARSADAVTYKMATAFEALLGYLHLSGETERLEAIVEEAFRIIEDRKARNTNE
ncbi:MAG: ribonuclease III domain-containing protein [Eubacteriaceae bacterium]|nr:ribonuclease III domain-containing protein [Eubacteriaceae bacterium]